MEKFHTFTGLAAPLDRANVDTDAIIPKQFLKSIKRSGFVQNLMMNGAIWIMESPVWIRRSVNRMRNSC